MIRVIHLGDRPYDPALLRRLRRAKGEYQDFADEHTFADELPLDLREGVRFAFIVVPEADPATGGRHTSVLPPPPFTDLCSVINNAGWFPVYYDMTAAWVIVIHK